MAKAKTRAAQKQKVTSKKAVTRDYQPIMIHHWGVRPRDLPLFTFLSIQAMLYDPTIRLGLAMRAAPVYGTKFGYKEGEQWKEGVQAKNQAVGEFVYRQLQRIWQHDVNVLVKSQLWGHAGGEIMLKLTDDNLVEVDRLLERHPNDVRVLKRGGQAVGIRISRLTHEGSKDLEWPKAYWTTYNAEAGTFYGTSILIGAYSPWYDKWCDGGALDVRRLFMHKDAYMGGTIYYPEGDIYVMPDGTEVPARDLGRQFVEQIVAGGVVAMPSGVDESGNRKWEFKPATVAANPSHILKYPQDLDTEMLRGIEVPDDIFTSDATSSGAWAGKKVPLSAFYAGLDMWIVQMIKDLCRCAFEPLVLLNFGKAEDFQITHKPLAEQAMEQQNQPQGQGQGQQPGQPGQGAGAGGDDGSAGAGSGMAGLFGGAGDGGAGGEQAGGGEQGGQQGGEQGGQQSLADLLSSPAAKRARQQGGAGAAGGGQQAQAMSLEAAIGRGVIDAAKIVQASRETLDAALVRMAGDAHYEGERNAEGLVFHGSRWHREDELPGATGAPGTHETTATPTVPNESHVAAYQRGDRSAAEQLLKQNAGLIYGFARKFAKHPDDMDDLQQEARIALLRAAQKFDPGRGLKFSTLATRSILNKLIKVSGRAGKRQSVWQQTPEDDEGRAIEPVTGPAALPMETSEQRAAVMQAVESLPGRAKTIVKRRYGLDGDPPETAAEIAERVGLTKQRVFQVLQKAAEVMRRDLEPWMVSMAIRMAGDVNPWTAYKGRHGGTGWKRSDTGEVRYQKDRPGAHEGGAAPRSAAPRASTAAATATAKPSATQVPSKQTPAAQPDAQPPAAQPPETPDELAKAVDAVAANPTQHGLTEQDAAKLQQAATLPEKVKVLDEATGHKFDGGGETQQPDATGEDDEGDYVMQPDGGIEFVRRAKAKPTTPTPAKPAVQPAVQPVAKTSAPPAKQPVASQPANPQKGDRLVLDQLKVVSQSPGKTMIESGFQEGTFEDYKALSKAAAQRGVGELEELVGSGKVQDVPLKDLIDTQGVVQKEIVAQRSKKPAAKSIVVAKLGGKMFIVDGHHTAVAERVRGGESIKAEVLDLDAGRGSQVDTPQSSQTQQESEEGDGENEPAKRPAVARGKAVSARREGKGSDAKIILEDGSPVPAHIQAAMIPPAWQNVKIYTDPKSEIWVEATQTTQQGVTGGKKVYNPTYEAEQQMAKHVRIEKMMEADGQIKGQIKAGLQNPATKEEAAVALLMDTQATRPGSERDTKGLAKYYGQAVKPEHVIVTPAKKGGAPKVELQIGKDRINIRDKGTASELIKRKASGQGLHDTTYWLKSHGATTLEARNVVEEDDGVHLKFVGKEGVFHDHLVRNQDLANILRERAKTANQRGGKLFDTDDGKVQNYVKSLDTGRFTPKDFRTKRATELALAAVKQYADKTPKDSKERQSWIMAVASKAAHVLGNQAKQCFETYINPHVWDAIPGAAA